jgi:hypothetical protein
VRLYVRQGEEGASEGEGSMRGCQMGTKMFRNEGVDVRVHVRCMWVRCTDEGQPGHVGCQMAWGTGGPRGLRRNNGDIRTR